MSNEQLSARIKEIRVKLDALKQRSTELKVKKESLAEKVEQLRPQIEQAFGTSDRDELLKKRDEFIAELETIQL